ncbi:hypothetical protein BVC80_8965g4 [Macleaya cordata]|uniref:Uncharacterized protein n=1 Tax=Macleaya cordata TaxID=56857 RepID=A0A200QB21_MACCD|nr:hypothetical protein BVC80_8965g4 [Macleaya cordata]
MPLKWWKRIDESIAKKNILKDYYDTERNMDCSGHGDYIMVCLNFPYLIAIGHPNHALMYNIKENTWAELPQCLDPDDSRRILFASPYSFEPEIGANWICMAVGTIPNN